MFICRGPRQRENVDMRVRHNPQPTLSYSGHHPIFEGRNRNDQHSSYGHAADHALERDRSRNGDVRHNSGLSDSSKWQPGGSENQFFDVVENNVGKAG